MQVSLRIPRVVKIDHHVDCVDVDAPSEQVGRDETASVALLEVVVDPVSVLLIHPGMDVKAAVAQRVDLLRQQFDSLPSVAEDNGLRDLELVEERREAVELLFLLEVGVVLCQAFQCELVTRPDEERLLYVPLLETLDLLGVRGAEQPDLRLGHQLDDLLDKFTEICREQLVDLVKDQQLTVRQVSCFFAGQVQDPSRCRNHNVDLLAQSVEVI